MKRIFSKKTAAAAFAAVLAAGLMLAGCSDGGSSGGDDSSSNSGSGVTDNPVGGGSENQNKPAIADGTYGYLTVKNGIVTKCDTDASGSVEIPEGVTEIGDYAFDGCSSLTSVRIPRSVTSIGGGAFFGCDGLKTVYYGGTEKQWTKLGYSFKYGVKFYYEV